MARNNSLFVFAYNQPLPPSAIAECLAAWSKCEVKSIDYVITDFSSYYFVHFKQMLPQKILNMLSSGQEPLCTRAGDIQVALDKSNGLDLNTTDTIVQFITNFSGSYYRFFKDPKTVFMWDEESANWISSAENPFYESAIQDVEMEDDFSTISDTSTTSATTIYGASFSIQSVDRLFCESDEETRAAPWAPIKKQKTRRKRYLKTYEELSICRTLFI